MADIMVRLHYNVKDEVGEYRWDRFPRLVTEGDPIIVSMHEAIEAIRQGAYVTDLRRNMPLRSTYGATILDKKDKELVPDQCLAPRPVTRKALNEELAAAMAKADQALAVKKGGLYINLEEKQLEEERINILVEAGIRAALAKIAVETAAVKK
jgi:hypothetical protein